MLYPLSYEGAMAQLTCQLIATSAQECPPALTAGSRRCSDRWSTHGACDHRLAPPGTHHCPTLTRATRACP
jgi:hypothetical protein